MANDWWKTEYARKLRDPRWLEARELIIARDGGACVVCGCEQRLQVHHRYYIRGREPWEYDHTALMTLCDECHDTETAIMECEKAAAKVRREHTRIPAPFQSLLNAICQRMTQDMGGRRAVD